MDKNHTLKPQQIAALLQIDYAAHVESIKQYKTQWKREYRERHVLNRLTFHNCRGWIYALKSFDREAAMGKFSGDQKSGGVHVWTLSHAKNRMYVFKMRELGRVEWFETGRVNFWVKKPASWAKVKTLLARAFWDSGVCSSVEVFDLWANTAKFKGAHLVVDTGEPLPYTRVDYLKQSNGIVAKLGDASNPTCLEIEFTYPTWAERNERIAEQTAQVLERVAASLELTTKQQEKFNEILGDLSAPKRPTPGNQDRLYG